MGTVGPQGISGAGSRGIASMDAVRHGIQSVIHSAVPIPLCYHVGMARIGRPKKVVDMKLVDSFCQMQCTLHEIANYFNCSEDTIEKRVREVHGISFADYFGKRRVTGLIALRRNLFRLSEKNVAAAIFLSKNYLGMADKQETTFVGDEKRPLIIKGVDKETREQLRQVLHGEGTERGTANHQDI